jgi:hypothetical protein
MRIRARLVIPSEAPSQHIITRRKIDYSLSPFQEATDPMKIGN